jgi:hypothetical protein
MGAYMHSLQAWGGDTTVTLSWTNPSENRFHHVRIVYSDSAEEIQSKAARTVFPGVIATEGGGKHSQISGMGAIGADQC